MRVLLIEDEPDLAAGLANGLRRDGYALDAAPDGRCGLHMAREVNYDLIVLDIMLPDLDGWEVLRRLRAASCLVPVLMLTARDTVPDLVRGLDMGADDYLVKPCDMTEFLARVRALIRRSAGKPSPVLEAGTVLINLATRQVEQAGKPIELTAREFSLLACFALHRGEVITRTRLYEQLYDAMEDTLSNLIDVHVFNLRRKLGREIILTRRGEGYILP